jgi:hypothetical protein
MLPTEPDDLAEAAVAHVTANARISGERDCLFMGASVRLSS